MQRKELYCYKGNIILMELLESMLLASIVKTDKKPPSSNPTARSEATDVEKSFCA